MSDLKPCHDCAARPGQPHDTNCDTARCLVTGMQRLQCYSDDVYVGPENAHEYEGYAMDHSGSCGEDIWTGEWPGVEDCRRLDLWCYWGPDYGQRGWVKCCADHPGATEDLNALVIQCDWDPVALQWFRP